MGGESARRASPSAKSARFLLCVPGSASNEGEARLPLRRDRARERRRQRMEGGDRPISYGGARRRGLRSGGGREEGPDRGGVAALPPMEDASAPEVPGSRP